LELPKPDFYLGVGSGSHTEQTAKIMIEFEKVLLAEKPNLVIVVGDVNSTIACSLTAVKLGIKVAHVEAGLRSFDRTMPEEINRILTDSISDYLFVTEQSGITNLKFEGVDKNKIHFVGHVMIDSLINFLPKAQKSNILNDYSLKKNKFILVTMHRPSNVDNEFNLKELITLLNRLSMTTKILFPVHPRTKKNLEKFDLGFTLNSDLIITDPLGYLDFIWLISNAQLILTDSGGIQEESTFLGVQCVTIRRTTERPITVEVGTNHLVGDSFIEAEKVADEILSGAIKVGKIPDLWDGRAAERIVDILIKDSD
jgi:UDP-N-acetylglucosamine 2-epimerase (non-hydrolysing)